MALSNAERQARWRAKRDREIEELRRAAEQAAGADVARLKAALKAARAEIAALRDELVRERNRREPAKAAKPAPQKKVRAGVR